MWYSILSVALTVWVIIDAKSRRANILGWACGTFLLAPAILPVYFTVRPLKSGESREGGKGWNLLKNFSIVWTLLMAVVAIWSVVAISQQTPTSNSDAEQAGFAIGTTLGLGMIGAIWFFPVLGTLVLGLLVKKSSIVEQGPTGAMIGIAETPETKSEEKSTVGSKKGKKSLVPVVVIIVLAILLAYVGVSFMDRRPHLTEGITASQQPEVQQAEKEPGRLTEGTTRPASQQTSDVLKTLLSVEEQCKQSFGEAAIQACQKVIEANPDDVEARIKLDAALVDLGRGREAIQKYADDIKKNPSDAIAHLNLCRVYGMMNFIDEALSECQKAIEINPALSRAYANMGFAYAQKNKHVKALESFREAIEHEPNLTEAYIIDIYIGIVVSMEALKRFDDALKEIDYMTQQWPADDRVYALRGAILSDLKKNEDALAALNKAIAINPKSRFALDVLGIILKELGRKDEALASFQKAAEFNPNSPMAHQQLGEAYLELGRKGDTLIAYQNYLKLKPNDTEVQKKVASLQSELGTNLPQDQANNPAAEQSIPERGAIKEWGTTTVELKDHSFSGKTANIVLLMKNPTDEEEQISSLLSFQALSEEGDLGEMSWTGTKCDGTILPQGVLKCRLSYTFPAPPLEVNLRVGAGIMTEAIYFKIKR